MRERWNLGAPLTAREASARSFANIFLCSHDDYEVVLSTRSVASGERCVTSRRRRAKFCSPARSTSRDTRVRPSCGSSVSSTDASAAATITSARAAS
jgi:hypothetical protein